MKESYKSFDELPMMISVSRVAKVLGISRTRSYELVNEKGFPKIKIGTRIVVPKDEVNLRIYPEYIIFIHILFVKIYFFRWNFIICFLWKITYYF